jgi:hypothetical protein
VRSVSNNQKGLLDSKLTVGKTAGDTPFLLRAGNSSFYRLVIHEWLGLALVVMIFAHLLLSWSWIASQTRGLFRQPGRARINYVLNLSLFAAMTALIFSGILISQYAIPGLTGAKRKPAMDCPWDSIHSRLSDFVVVLTGRVLKRSRSRWRGR